MPDLTEEYDDDFPAEIRAELNTSRTMARCFALYTLATTLYSIFLLLYNPPCATITTPEARDTTEGYDEDFTRRFGPN